MTKQRRTPPATLEGLVVIGRLKLHIVRRTEESCHLPF